MNIYKIPILNPIKFYTEDYKEDLPNDFINWKNTSPDKLGNFDLGNDVKVFKQPINKDFKFQFWVRGNETFKIELWTQRELYEDSNGTNMIVKNITPIDSEIEGFNIFTLQITPELIDQLKLQGKAECLEFKIVEGAKKIFYSNKFYIPKTETLEIKYKDNGLKLGLFFDSEYTLLIDKFIIKDWQIKYTDEEARTVDMELRLLKSFYSKKVTYLASKMPQYFTRTLSYVLSSKELIVDGEKSILRSDISQNFTNYEFDIQSNEFKTFDYLCDNMYKILKKTNIKFFDTKEREPENDLLFHHKEMTDFVISTKNSVAQLRIIIRSEDESVYYPTINFLHTDAESYNYFKITIDNSMLETNTVQQVFISKIGDLNSEIKSEFFSIEDLNIQQYPKTAKIKYKLDAGEINQDVTLWLKNVEVTEDKYKIEEEVYKNIKEQEKKLSTFPTELIKLKFNRVSDSTVLKLADILTKPIELNGTVVVRNGGLKLSNQGNGINTLEIEFEVFFLNSTIL